MNHPSIKTLLALTGALAIGQGAAMAGFTSVATTGSDDPGLVHLHELLGIDVADINADPNSYRMPDSGAGNDRTFTFGELKPVTVTKLILEIAGNSEKNTFGIYDPVGGDQMIELFNGPAGSGASATLELSKSAGQVTVKVGATSETYGGTTIGFYLGTPSGTFYSQPVKNPDSADQMVTFTSWNVASLGGQSLAGIDYLLAWEDIALKDSDGDYNDMIVGLAVVPEPSTYFAAALLGLPFAASLLRRRLAKLA